MCGAGWRNSVYHITGQVDLDVLQTAVTYTYEGCFVDTPSRELSGPMFNMGDQATVRVCAELCVGYTYFGVQAEQQCFCGDTNAAVAAAQDSECNSECRDHATGGDTHTICGGSWRNSVYRITAAESLIRLPEDEVDVSFRYLGCFVDDASRDMGDEESGATHGDLGPGATTQMCADHCRDGGFREFATQYASHCFCDNRHGSLGEAPESDCNMACRGDASATCGGPWRNSVYVIEASGGGGSGR